MATTRAYNVYVGAETGLLKGLNIADRSWQNLNGISETSRSREVTCLCWGNDDQSEICVGLRDNTVLLIDSSGSTSKEVGPLSCTSGHMKAIAKYDEQFMTGFSNGVVSMWREDNLEEEFVKINTGDNLWALSQNRRQRNIIATGGKENPLKLWDINKSSTPIFTAKNVRNDWLNLRVPVWVTRTAFLGEGRRVVTGTGHHQVYVYDPSLPQRRPVLDLKFLEHPITALAVQPGADHHVIVGNTFGDMGLLDLRHKKVVQLYKGFSGGITDIQCHCTMPFIVSCSIDRFVRVHNIHDKSLTMKFYLKARLNCLVLTDDWPEEESELGSEGVTKQTGKITAEEDGDGSKSSNADEDNAVWDSLGVVKTKTVPQKDKKRSAEMTLSELVTVKPPVPKKKKRALNRK